GLEPGKRLDAEPLEPSDGVVPGADLRRARRRPQPAVVAEVRVDPVLRAEGADRRHAVGRLLREPQRLLRPAQPLERAELRPPRQHEAAVAAARASPADVALDEDDVDGGIELLQAQRGPQSREAAADDADVRPDVALERRGGLLTVEGFLEPQAAHAAHLRPLSAPKMPSPREPEGPQGLGERQSLRRRCRCQARSGAGRLPPWSSIRSRRTCSTDCARCAREPAPPATYPRLPRSGGRRSAAGSATSPRAT